MKLMHAHKFMQSTIEGNTITSTYNKQRGGGGGGREIVALSFPTVLEI